MENKKKKKFAIDEIDKSWLLLCLAISFMLCIFAPLENFFANKTEFWFELNQILPIVLIIFVIAGVIMSIIGYLVNKSKIGIYIYNFLFCGLLFFYIQGNYIPRNYGVLNGVDIDWNSYTSYAIASIILFFMCFVIWIIVSLKVKEKIYFISRVVCIILVLIQMVTIGTLYLQNYVLKKDVSNNLIVTRKDMFNLSKNNNILVFVLDTFDSYDMKVMLEEEEGKQWKEIFENFTYYPDTLGAYPTTKGALPYILTGEWYENNKTYTNYIKDAYISNKIYSTLKSNDYSIGVYTSSLYVNPECDLYTNIIEGNYIIGDYISFIQKLYKLVAFNYMPHQLKKNFYITSTEFDELKSTTQEYKSYSYNVQTFNNVFINEGITLTDEGNCFRFYHLEGVHAPYTFDKNLISNEEEVYDVYDEISGNFNLLKYIFDELKKYGIYDTTSIIVMADHGDYGFSQNPLFMIKNAGENHEFTISNAQMSYEYLSEIFVSLADGEEIKEENIIDFKKDNEKRRFIDYSWGDFWDREYMPNMVEYMAVGNAGDIDNLVMTGNYYIAGDSDIDYSYHFNEKLSFKEESTANKYCFFGFSKNEGMYTWTDGIDATMLFTFEEEFDNLELSIEYFTYTQQQRVVIYANDNQVADYIASGKEKKNIVIPGEYIDNGNLNLHFEFPQAISPQELGEGFDSRKLALAFESILISSTKEEFNMEEQLNAYKYSLGTKLSFETELSTGNAYCINGFSKSEVDFTWTNGNEAKMQFSIKEDFKNLLVNLEYLRTFNSSQYVIIYANEKKVVEYMAVGKEEKQFIIPKEYVENGELTLRFEFPNAVSPKELEQGNDPRKLALAFSSITISSTSEIFNESVQIKSYKYSLGTELSFSNENPTVNKYCVQGFSSNEKGFTWTNGNEAEMNFEIKEDFEDLLVSIELLRVFNLSQYVIIYVNGNEIVNYTAMEAEIKEFIISKEYVEDGLLVLKFEFPDAISPKELGISEDSRVLALAMKSLTITSTSEEGEN